MREINCKITFGLDGTGVFYDPYEPPMLDAIFAAARAKYHVHGEPPKRDEPPDFIPLPLKMWHRDGFRGWHASALFPTGEAAEQLLSIRKRFRERRVELTLGTANLKSGQYKNWNIEMPMLMTSSLYGYFVYVGDEKLSKFKRDCIRDLRWIGKKRAEGRGCVTSLEIERIEEDYSLVKDGKAMRYLPDKNGWREVRMIPPYWNNHDRVRSCEISDDIGVSI